MKKVIRFTRVRIYMFILSILLIAAGIAAIIINDGFNLGIDFQAGMNLRVQIADPVMSVTYDGEGDATAVTSRLSRSTSFSITASRRSRSSSPRA